MIRGSEPNNWADVVSKAASLLEKLRAVIDKELPHIEPRDNPVISYGDCRYGSMFWLRNDHYVGRALELYGEYSESEVELLRKVLQPGDIVIDAGANIGALTIPLSRIVGPTGKVYAFEPQLAYFDLLNGRETYLQLYNVATIRGDLEAAEVHFKALGSRVDTITMRCVETDKIHAPGWESTGSEYQVSQITVDSLELKRCDLIKIDVDGQELNILKGAEETIGRCRPFLYVENDKPEQYPDLIPWIHSHDYRIYQHFAPLYNPDNFRANPVNVFGKLVSAMILCVPNERKDVHPGEWGLSRIKVSSKGK
jgi:FkbM family methyltransferase